ncbi:hypothetical protein [Persephonella sp.]
MKTKYLEVARTIKDFMKKTEDSQLREFLGRTAISRTYEAAFLEIYYHITDDLNITYTQLKSIAKEYYRKKNLKIPINKHTIVGAYIAVNYGEIFGRLFEELRQARNDVDYNLKLELFPFGIGIEEVSEYIKRTEILLDGVLK